MKNEIAVQLLWVLLGIFGIGGVFIAWAWRGKDSKGRLWITWFLEGLILAAVFVPAYLGGWWLLASVVALAIAVWRELARTLASGGQRPVAPLGLVATLGAIALGHARPELLPGLSAATIAAFLAARAASGGASPETLPARLRSTLFGVVYPGLGLAHVVALGALDGGFGYIVLCYGLIEVNDSGAFLVGSALGKRKIFPALSPNKTIEGCLGGLIATLLAAFALRFAVPGFSTPILLCAALLLGLAGLSGDLFASRIKRQAGVKDFGEAVPMHGGLLDVYDSFLFGAPLFYYFVLAL